MGAPALIRPFIVFWIAVVSLPVLADEGTYDVVVYGGTPAGVAAAVEARRMGKSAVIVCPETHLGGMSSAGLGWTDSGDKTVVGGLAREFYRRIKKHYDDPQAWVHQQPREYPFYRPDADAMWAFEPKVAERVFEQMVAEAQVPVMRGQWLDRQEGVKKRGGRVTSITTLDGQMYRGRIFIDATYEGDLMAAAGVGYTVGRESNDKYGETLNGVQTRNAKHHQFEHRIDPYIRPGDPSSGILPRIHHGGPGEEGRGDHRVQAYNFRLCLTNIESNRVPFPRPQGYDPWQYELLLRYIQAGWRDVFKRSDPVPNGKTDTNNYGAFSTDNIGFNYDYPEASYERRREIIQEHEAYQKGLFYFLANDPRVPQELRSEVSAWGLAADEFLDNGHWPHQIYVREARRMVSDFVLTERHLRAAEPTPMPIGMGSYYMDSHNTQRYVAHDESGRAYVRNEGDIQANPGGPYPIGYGAILPKKSECENLLVPVCISASHIAYGSVRMEPVFMVLGQSAAIAASHAIEAQTALQDVPYDTLRARLLEAGQVLEFSGPRTVIIASATLGGIVVDDEQAQFTGRWTASGSSSPFVDVGYHHDGNADKSGRTARFEARVPKAGPYEVRLAYSAHPNRATNVPVIIRHANGTTTIRLNQTQAPPIDGLFLSLGTFIFNPERPARVEISNTETDGYVVADAVQWLGKGF